MAETLWSAPVRLDSNAGTKERMGKFPHPVFPRWDQRAVRSGKSIQASRRGGTGQQAQLVQQGEEEARADVGTGGGEQQPQTPGERQDHQHLLSQTKNRIKEQNVFP